MISYATIPTKDFIRVKWKKQEIGRIYREGSKWHYRPRGCSGGLRSEEFGSLTSLKLWIEGKDMS
ncbi:hypothetical protein vBPFY1MI_107 [Pseudomonas phage vB_PF_Y1-MI]|nr:hypothetical protein vBPFY1MI_107 [Pseudomonas phage vB_PF_Y1-MI]